MDLSGIYVILWVVNMALAPLMPLAVIYALVMLTIIAFKGR
jgi:hypothetical protein